MHTGADSKNSDVDGGTYYDSVYAPVEPGSGGGGANGGAGGAAIHVIPAKVRALCSL